MSWAAAFQRDHDRAFAIAKEAKWLLPVVRRAIETGDFSALCPAQSNTLGRDT